MKAMMAAFATMVVITVGADVVLDQIGFSAEEQGSGAAVRLDQADG